MDQERGAINQRRITMYMETLEDRQRVRQLAFENTVSESVMARRLVVEAMDARKANKSGGKP